MDVTQAKKCPHLQQCLLHFHSSATRIDRNWHENAHPTPVRSLLGGWLWGSAGIVGGLGTISPPLHMTRSGWRVILLGWVSFRGVTGGTWPVSVYRTLNRWVLLHNTEVPVLAGYWTTTWATDQRRRKTLCVQLIWPQFRFTEACNSLAQPWALYGLSKTRQKLKKNFLSILKIYRCWPNTWPNINIINKIGRGRWTRALGALARPQLEKPSDLGQCQLCRGYSFILLLRLFSFLIFVPENIQKWNC